MNRITLEKAFATAVQGETIVGTGIAVVDGNWLGLFGLITDEAVRRQGIATAITQSLILWGINRGATDGYLQVEERNEPAKALYSSLGFEETYTYWYRVVPE
jgi:ribosomal protein S18 acetylase RimI-like enzyme